MHCVPHLTCSFVQFHCIGSVVEVEEGGCFVWWNRPGIQGGVGLPGYDGETIRDVALYVPHFEQVVSVNSRRYDIAEGISMFRHESEWKKLTPGVARHYVGHVVPLASPVNMVVPCNDKVDPVFDKEPMELVPCLFEDVEPVEG